jgi:excisionase family DNA binding protein
MAVATVEESPIKLSELARGAGVTYQTAWRWAAQGRIPVIRAVGGQYRVPAEAARKLLEPRGGEPESAA